VWCGFVVVMLLRWNVRRQQIPADSECNALMMVLGKQATQRDTADENAGVVNSAKKQTQSAADMNVNDDALQPETYVDREQ